ncbi:hypothetical protein MD484_g6545, partial [Candolleomyces efflorescens]
MDYTGVNAPPSEVGHSMYDSGHYGPGESTIWRLDTCSGYISAQWTNFDATQVAISFLYDTTSGDVILTGDVAAYQAARATGTTYAVTIRFAAGGFQ